jgi:hypothetical protein
VENYYCYFDSKLLLTEKKDDRGTRCCPAQNFRTRLPKALQKCVHISYRSDRSPFFKFLHWSLPSTTTIVIAVAAAPAAVEMPSTTTTNNNSVDEHDSELPPVPRNPFSPPASVISFSSDSPAVTPGQHAGPYFANNTSGYFAEQSSGHATPAAGSSRPGSRPTTGVSSGLREDSFRIRESFASPPSRPLTVSSNPITTSGVPKTRMKSTMLEDPSKLEKPWLENKDKAPTIAYFLTYGVMMIGVAGAVIKGYFDWKTTPFMSDNLCPVVDEDFNGDSDIFGDNGLFMREVDMSGFGYVVSLSL